MPHKTVKIAPLACATGTCIEMGEPKSHILLELQPVHDFSWFKYYLVMEHEISVTVASCSCIC